MLTKDEIMKLTGHELDAAVAEAKGNKYIFNNEHPSYSTNIAAAWELVEEMKANDFWWSASYKKTLHIGDIQAVYETRFRCVRATRGDFTATAIGLPEAICRAFLLAEACVQLLSRKLR